MKSIRKLIERCDGYWGDVRVCRKASQFSRYVTVLREVRTFFLKCFSQWRGVMHMGEVHGGFGERDN